MIEVRIKVYSGEGRLLAHCAVTAEAESGRLFPVHAVTMDVVAGGVVDRVMAYLPSLDATTECPILERGTRLERGNRLTLEWNDAPMLTFTAQAVLRPC